MKTSRITGGTVEFACYVRVCVGGVRTWVCICMNIYMHACTRMYLHVYAYIYGVSQVVLVVENLLANARNVRDTGSIPGSG